MNGKFEHTGTAQNGSLEELSREDVRALAGEVLGALGVERVEMDEGEEAVVRRAVEEWKRGKAREMGNGI